MTTNREIRLYTIGFTEKAAEKFFTLLTANRVRTLIDTRISNSSQLSGFAKGRDLAFFCRVLGGMRYEHRPDMAPTKELLRSYRKSSINWEEYAREYIGLLEARRLADKVTLEDLEDACFLCSEHRPEHCHRSLLTEYLRRAHPRLRPTHLY